MKESTIGELCNVIGGKPAPSEKEAFENGVVPFLRMRDLGAYHLTNNLIEIQDKLNIDYVKKKNLKPIKRGAILLPRSGSVALNHRAILGVDAVIVSHVCALEILNEKILDRKYFYYYMTRVNMANITKKTTGLDAITFEDLRQIKIPLPDLKNQQKIASIFEQADAAHQKRKQANQLTEQFLQSAFLKMFGDPVRNEKGWEVKKLDDYISFLTSGSRGWAKYYSNEGDLFIRIENVGRSKFFLEEEKLQFVNAPESAEAIRTEVQEGDLLISITADLGRTTVVQKLKWRGFINQHLALVRLKKGVNPIFLSNYFSSIGGQSQFKAMNKGGVKAGLNFNDIKSLKFILPPLPLQQKFASIAEHVEQLRIKQRESERELENLFNSLMQRYFGN